MTDEECNELRQENEVLRSENRQASAAIDKLKAELEDAQSQFEAVDRDNHKLRTDLSKDTAAIIAIDKVMLCAGQHWPDVEGEAMIVRHVKWLTRTLTAEMGTNRTLLKAVAELRRAVRTAWMMGVEDWKRHYDPELLALMGCEHFQDLYNDAPLPILKEHITDGSPCWCYPEINYTDPDTGVSVIVHKDPQ